MVKQHKTVLRDGFASHATPNLGETKVEWLPVETLRVNLRNARIHPKKQVRQIANSISAAGFLGAIIIDEDGIVLAGHGRLAAAKLLGMRSVPTQQVTGLTDVQKRAFALADNKICENAGYNREILVKELGELGALLEPTRKWDISLTGFEAPEIDAFVRGSGKPKKRQTRRMTLHSP